MKFTDQTFILIMGILQNHLYIAKRDKNKAKEKKTLEAMQEVEAIGVY